MLVTVALFAALHDRWVKAFVAWFLSSGSPQRLDFGRPHPQAVANLIVFAMAVAVAVAVVVVVPGNLAII